MEALVDIALFEKIRLLEAEFERLATELAHTHEGLDEKTIMAEIEEAVDAARHRSSSPE